MGRSKKYGRPVHGVLMLEKPAGLTSNAALQRAKRFYKANKAGHTGSLDPLATGVLPICFGEATKFSQHLLDADKGYITTVKLGEVTDTWDAEGELTQKADASKISGDAIASVLGDFRGEIEQIPPMVSALKKDGKPLYKLARKGIEVDRPARKITIKKIEMLDFRPGEVAEVDLEILCSKGTYIRSIAKDLGDMLGVGGHVAKLHRHYCGSFSDKGCISLDQIESLALEQSEGQNYSQLDNLLKPVDALIDDLPVLQIGEDSSHYFCHGQAVMDLGVYRLGEQGDTVRVCREDGCFLGIGEITDDGRIAPRRLVVFDR